jgi:ABC-2 type transport system ATP-binding protein
MNEPAIELRGLTKSFDGSPAIDSIDLTVPKGSVFGFLGPNGAGKTTTQRILVGLARPTSGKAYVMGYDVEANISDVRKVIGFLPDVPSFYPWMTGMEYLLFVGDIFGLPAAAARTKAAAAMERTGLKDVKKRIGGYSRGMKQRLGIAQALINEPRVILMDEPTSALDPIGRKDVLDTIEALGKEITVFFSTHILNDVERVCDTVAILNKGKVLKDQSLDSLKAGYASKPVFSIKAQRPVPDLIDKLRGLPWVTDIHEAEDNMVRVGARDIDEGRIELAKLVALLEIPFRSIEVIEPNLEEIFMQVVGEA